MTTVTVPPSDEYVLFVAGLLVVIGVTTLTMLACSYAARRRMRAR